MISPVGPPSFASLEQRGTGISQPSSKSEFRAFLESAIHRVESTRTEATATVDKFLSGESEELHTAALAVQKAELEFDMFMQVRNKVVSAYQEIMRMQV
jgi:flagellar hook-basal body complex protein FliE